MGLFAGTKWDDSFHCDRCGVLQADCRCPPSPPSPKDPADQKLRIAIEKRKGGRVVTTIRGFFADDPALAERLTQLKNHCGAGGSREADMIVIQGDQRLRAAELLKQLGYHVT